MIISLFLEPTLHVKCILEKEENLETWKLFKDLSIKELEQIYEVNANT